MQRKTPLANEEFYHIFNRGVDKRTVFLDRYDYERYIVSMYFLNTKEDGLMNRWRDFKKLNPKAKPSDFKVIEPEERLVDIVCYCLNENHKHKILRQLQEKGIETFMQKIGTSYAMYFNKKYKRSGALFQGPFKSVHIENNEQLLYVSVYVNANQFVHNSKAKPSESEGFALNWPYSSLPDYLGKRSGTLCNMDPVLGQFKDAREYEGFVKDNVWYMKERKEMEKHVIE